MTRTAQARNTRIKRNRAAVDQKYIQKLPLEFRKQVANYFEALAE